MEEDEVLAAADELDCRADGEEGFRGDPADGAPVFGEPESRDDG